MTGASVQLFGGVLLLCAFLRLARRRFTGLITLYRIEALALAAAAFCQGFVQGIAALCLAGIFTLAIQAVLFPIALRRIARRFNPVGAGSVPPAGIAMILGVALIGVASLVMPPGREDLVLGLSVVLLGLLAMTVKGDAFGQVIGFLSVANGLMLTAVFMPGLPFVAALAVALPVLAAFMLAGVFFLHGGQADPAGQPLR